MDMVGSITWWAVVAIAVVSFFCGIYMLITGKVLLSYLTIGAGKFTEESKRAFSKFGGIALVLAMPGIALFKIGLDELDSMPVVILGLVMSIIGIVFYMIGRKKLIREQ